MNQEMARVSVRILEKDYHVACPIEERAALLDSAEFLSRKMKEIRDTGKIVGLDRIAVMAALNLANELLVAQRRDALLGTGVTDRVRAMRERVEAALDRGQPRDVGIVRCQCASTGECLL